MSYARNLAEVSPHGEPTVVRKLGQLASCRVRALSAGCDRAQGGLERLRCTRGARDTGISA